MHFSTMDEVSLVEISVTTDEVLAGVVLLTATLVIDVLLTDVALFNVSLAANATLDLPPRNEITSFLASTDDCAKANFIFLSGVLYVVN